MADIEITVDGGTSKRLLTAGKYCDKDILVTATGGGGGEPEPPDDGKTRLYITVPANSMPDRDPPRNQVPLYIQQSVANGVTIDWGDGSAPETLPGTGNVHTTHTYQQAGDYVISLYPAEGCDLGFGDGIGNCIFGKPDESGYVYTSMLNKVMIGAIGVRSIGDGSFYGCISLQSVKISYGVENIGVGSFSSCYSLSSINIPDSVTFIGESAFGYCASLSSLDVSNSVNSFSDYTFADCYSLPSVKIPSNITSIGIETFYNCYGIKEYHLLPKIPPNMLYANSIFVSPDCIIYVPVGSLEAYQTATNWSTYAGQMREEGT